MKCAALLWVIAACGRIDFDPLRDGGGDGPGPPVPQLDGQWTWISGSNVGEQAGVYGTQGVADPANIPGARDNGAFWLRGDELWLFAGYGMNATGAANRLADLWRYDIPTGMWTWIHGGQLNITGTYGTLGVAASTNRPGSRNDAVGWTASDGSLWLFAGVGLDAAGALGKLRDVWRFEPATAQWTWIAGGSTANEAGTYGQRGVSAPSSSPGARSSLTVAVSGNQVWLYGGHGRDASGAADGFLGDLWRFDITTREWTWINGATTINAAAAWGTQGVPSTANTPGGRLSPCLWLRDGDVWLFGGFQSGGRYNDLWRYTPTDDTWTWLGGANGIGAGGTWGTRGVEAAGNVPSSRDGMQCWQDAAGDFWMMGGLGLDASNTAGYLADLWRYSPARDAWTWVAGPELANQLGVYGQRGVADPGNVPGGRYTGAAWLRADGSLWLFGGDSAYDSVGMTRWVNDLWRFAAP